MVGLARDPHVFIAGCLLLRVKYFAFSSQNVMRFVKLSGCVIYVFFLSSVIHKVIPCS